MMETFDIMISNSYDYKHKDYLEDHRWTILKNLYENNFVISDNRDYGRLPKKIHQIWVGCPFPAKYGALADTWKRFNPAWEYRLWTDKDIDEVGLPDRGLYESITNNGQKSDFLRYHILNSQGGLYVDTDFECLHPFDNFSYLDFLTGIGYPSKVELYIGLIATIPHHPIIERIVLEMNNINSGNWRNIFNSTGSYFFTRVFFEVVGEYMKGVVAMPTGYFYPFSNQTGHQNRDGKKYVKGYSFALHHWAVSWL